MWSAISFRYWVEYRKVVGFNVPDVCNGNVVNVHRQLFPRQRIAIHLDTHEHLQLSCFGTLNKH